MKIKLGLLKQIINEESQKLNEARYKATRDDVKILQRAINAVLDTMPGVDPPIDDEKAMAKYTKAIEASELKPDGIFGRNTRKALIAVQRQEGLTPDGVAGPDTFDMLDGEITAQITGAPSGVQDALKQELDPIANDLARLGTEKALIGSRMGKKQPKRKSPEEQKTSIAVGDKPEGTPKELVDKIQTAMYPDVDRSGGPVKRRGPTGAAYLEEEGARATVVEKLQKLSKESGKTLNNLIHVLGTLKDDDGIKGKRMSQLKSALVDLVDRRGQSLLGHYERLIKGYRGILGKTSSGNRGKMKQELSARIARGAKDTKAKFGLEV
jgi:hypothetical protein